MDKRHVISSWPLGAPKKQHAKNSVGIHSSGIIRRVIAEEAGGVKKDDGGSGGGVGTAGKRRNTRSTDMEGTIGFGGV